ncbi:MAG: hypothetical protein N2505_00535 [Endomicrobia bacterium]|nr:hypothetical protein [Endomicrobiia bacterium]
MSQTIIRKIISNQIEVLTDSQKLYSLVSSIKRNINEIKKIGIEKINQIRFSRFQPHEIAFIVSNIDAKSFDKMLTYYPDYQSMALYIIKNKLNLKDTITDKNINNYFNMLDKVIQVLYDNRQYIKANQESFLTEQSI